MILKRIFLLLGWFNESGPGDAQTRGWPTWAGNEASSTWNTLSLR